MKTIFASLSNEILVLIEIVHAQDIPDAGKNSLNFCVLPPVRQGCHSFFLVHILIN